MENIDPRILAVTLLIIIVSTLVLLKKKPKELLKVDIDDLINDADETWNSAQGDHKSNSDDQDQDQKKGEENDKHIKAQEQTQTQTKLKNVFDVKQPPPNVGNPQLQPQPQRTSKTTSTEKPFKSSYYYAHNQMKKTGGYTDGLKAEDYVMNGPKLLSKGKSTLASSSGEGTGTGTDVKTNSKSDAGYTRTSTPATTTISTTITSAQAATKNGAGNSIPINRYLWDDDGNEKRLAKIYIDTLPGKVGKSPLPVQEASITKEDVVCKLVGEAGLMIQIRRKDTDADGDGDENAYAYARYHLYIPSMHGEVEDVKTIVKAKKVIVKLTKKKTKGNAKAWPQLPSKVVKSTPDGVDYANEDLFLSSS